MGCGGMGGSMCGGGLLCGVGECYYVLGGAAGGGSACVCDVVLCTVHICFAQRTVYMHTQTCIHDKNKIRHTPQQAHTQATLNTNKHTPKQTNTRQPTPNNHPKHQHPQTQHPQHIPVPCGYSVRQATYGVLVH